MKDLEVQTYNFAVEGIGLVKSLEKEYPHLASSELKQALGGVSLKYIDAIESKENEDFAKNLRACHSNTQKSAELLTKLEGINNDTLEKQKEKLITDSNIIVDKLNKIIEKLIY